MKSNPIPANKNPRGRNRIPRLCQACGETAVLKTYESGAPDVVDGHRTRDCDEMNQYVYASRPSPFGIVVPQEDSDVIWSFQTNGLMCSHPTIRGTYIPLTTPSISPDEVKYGRVATDPREGSYFEHPLRLLVETNYANNTSEDYDLEYVWDLIDRELPFMYREAESPKGYRDTHEAWKWVTIVGKNYEVDGAYTDLDALVGERVLLVYPNSD